MLSLAMEVAGSGRVSKRTVGDLNLAETASVLNAKVAAVHRGDLREAEAILKAFDAWRAELERTLLKGDNHPA
jgi:hypothetical protein